MLFQPRDTWRLLPDIFDSITGTDGKDYSIGLGKAATYVATRNDAGLIEREFLDAGQGAPVGAIIYYYLPESLPDGTDIRLSITDDSGTEIRCFRPKPEDYERWDDDDKALSPGPWIPTRPGMHRFIWDARHPPAQRLRTNKTATEAERGPLALPGHYQVLLQVGTDTLEESFELINDPRSPAGHDDLAQQLRLLLEIHTKLTLTYRAVARLRDVREQVHALQHRLSSEARFEPVHARATELLIRLDTIESALILPGEQEDLFGLHDRVRLNAALASVISVIESADAKPTVQARELTLQYMTQIDALVQDLETVFATELVGLTQATTKAGLTSIIVPNK